MQSVLFSLVVVAGLAACSQTQHQHNHHGHDHSHDDHDHAHHHAPNYTAWQNYQCTNGKTLRVRYDAQMAEVAMGAQQKTLKHDAQNSNTDVQVFADGEWKWMVNSQHGYTNTKSEANGFLTRDEVQTVNGKAIKVDNILAKNCNPV